MATRYYSFAENEFYHIYNRGNSKQLVFKNESDFLRFEKILYIANTSDSFTLRDLKDIDVFDIDRKDNPLVHIGAYCLMQNHYHLLLTPAQKDGIPRFMLKLATSYVSYFNKKYNRTGSLFENSYKAKFVDSDKYLKYLFAYIHLNPFRDKGGEIKKIFNEEKLLEYPHSSLPGYLGLFSKQNKILAPEKFPKYFASKELLKHELFEWLDFDKI